MIDGKRPDSIFTRSEQPYVLESPEMETNGGMMQNVLYITIDSIRADRVGYLGYHGNTTPTIDALAADGTYFEHGIANGIPTYYSFKSLLGGIHALSHDRSIGLPETARSIAEVFRDAGYATAGFNAQNPWLTPSYGYNKGFDTFEDFMGDSDAGPNIGALTRRAKQIGKRSVAFSDTLTDTLGQLGRIVSAIVDSQPLIQAEIVTDTAIGWLESRNRDRPFFLWIHYMDPHYPWVPPMEYLRGREGENLSRIDIGRLWHTVAYQYQRESATVDDRMMRQIDQLYDAELRRLDTSIDRLLDTVDSTIDDDELLIALAGDHGTELNDHGGLSHGPRKLYQEVIRVPLLFSGPSVPDTHREIGALVDIPQTISQLSGAVDSPVETFEGIHLLEEERESVPTEVVYDIDQVRQQNTENALLRSCTSPPWKLIRNEEVSDIELYNLDTDPNETVNRASKRLERVKELTKKLNSHRETIERRNRTVVEKQRIRRVIADLRDAGEI